jgi:integrase
VTTLHQADLGLAARTVRVRAAYVRRDSGPLLLGPPKSRAGRRIVGIPAAIVPDLERYLAVYVVDDPAALVFPGVIGGPFRRQNFNKLTGWPDAVEAVGAPGLHFHDLRHTGN